MIVSSFPLQEADMAMIKDILSEEKLSEALDMMVKWFPEEATTLESNREVFISHILEGTDPAPGSALTTLQRAKKTEDDVPLSSLTPCQEACALVVVDVLNFVYAFYGLHVSNQKQLYQQLVLNLGGKTLGGFAESIKAFSACSSSQDQLNALYTLGQEIYDAGGFKVVRNLLYSQLGYSKWVKYTIVSYLYNQLWFGQGRGIDGFTFQHVAALSYTTAAQLRKDAAAVECDK